MIFLWIASILVIATILLYLINPRDIFGIRQVLMEKRSKIYSIDYDSDGIINILKDQPQDATPEAIELLKRKFSICISMKRSKSSLYRFFGYASEFIIRSLHRNALYFDEKIYIEINENLKIFAKAIEHSDFEICYDSITNIVYLITNKRLPNPIPEIIDECIQKIKNYYIYDKSKIAMKDPLI